MAEQNIKPLKLHRHTHSLSLSPSRSLPLKVFESHHIVNEHFACVNKGKECKKKKKERNIYAHTQNPHYLKSLGKIQLSCTSVFKQRVSSRYNGPVSRLSVSVCVNSSLHICNRMKPSARVAPVSKTTFYMTVGLVFHH